MQGKIKYDVVLSCTGEDLVVAKSIAAALKDQNISYYLYTEHQAEHWGEDILKISIDKYMLEGRLALILISRNYINKKWTEIERQIMQTVSSRGEAYILPLRLDDTPVDGLSSNISYVWWQNDPEKIAALVGQKLRAVKEKAGPVAVEAPMGETNFHAKTIIVNQGPIDNQTFNIS